MGRSSKVGNTVDNSSDTNFRAWGKFISDTLQANGWTKTGDTGQINWATVLAPVAGATVAGYEMYVSADAGIGQNNYYVKIEYGSGSVAARPGIWITVGWAVDGAGNIVTTTYPSSTRTQITTNAAASGTPIQYCSASGNAANGAGYMTWVCAQNNASLSFGFSVERTRNSDLTFKDQIFIILGTIATWGSTCQVTDRNNAFPTFTANAQTCIAPPVANTPIAGVAALQLVFGLAPGLTSPSLIWLGTESSAIGRINDIVNITILGVVHTYVILDSAAFAMNSEQTMMRYE